MGVQDRDWFWSDREGSSRVGHAPPAPQHRGRLGTYSPAVLIVTVMGVASLVWVIGFSAVQWRAQTAAEHFRRTAHEAQRKSQLEAQHAQRDAQARQEQRQSELQQREAARLKAIVEQRRVEDDERRATAAASDRKAKAWAKFYSPPPGCSDAATVACANSYIRAKREFDEKYLRGAL